MAEPRKIVLILGNGFDLDLGLKTSYKDFWQSEFCPKSFPAPLIAHLNEKWGDNLEEVKWYDLENQLFIYYRDIVSKGKRKDIIDEYEAKFLKIFTWDDHSEVEIKRSLQKMTDNNLSTLYGLNHVEVIKTSMIKEKPERINAFLLKHICDSMQVRATLQKLLRSDR